MRRFSCILLALFFIISCSSDDSGTNSDNNTPTPNGTDYYPLAVGNVWYYSTYFDGIKSGPTTRQISEQTTLPNGTVVLNQGSKLTYVRKTDDALLFYYDLADNDVDCSWPWPFAIGNQIINCTFDGGGEVRDGIFATKETITVPAGTFECYRLDWPDYSEWFAPGIGRVLYRETYDQVIEDRLDSFSLK